MIYVTKSEESTIEKNYENLLDISLGEEVSDVVCSVVCSLVCSVV